MEHAKIEREKKQDAQDEPRQCHGVICIRASMVGKP